MAEVLPPFPQRADPGDFAWVQWMNQLNALLSTTGALAWTLVDKSGSSLGDLQNKAHSLLTNVLGTGSYHISSTEAAYVTALPNISGNAATATTATNSSYLTVTSSSSDPTTSDIAAGKAAIWKNTTSGLLKLWSNDGGTMKSVLLT
jgi:hypothetical protein